MLQNNLIHTALTEISYLYGDDYISQLVVKLAGLLDADLAFVAKLNLTKQTPQTLAFWCDGQLVEHIEYPLKDTPCADVSCNGTACINGDALARYHRDEFLQQQDIRSYIGVVLNDNQGRPIGIMSAMFRRAVQQPDDMLGVFNLCSFRASAELNRYIYEHQLSEQISQLKSSNEQLTLAQQTIAYQACHDQLTSLYNRYEFNRLLTGKLEKWQGGGKGAFILLDVDNFKSINDSLGHSAGDSLLMQVSSRLKTLLPKLMLGRMGGDEFALFANIASIEEARQLAREIQQLFNQPFSIAGGVTTATTSVGISCFPDDAKDAKGLYSCADQALYQAKYQGRNTQAVFTEQLRQSTQRQQQVHQHLVEAIEQRRIEVYYQPIVSIQSGEIHYCEALARWFDEQLGQVAPDEFIEVAEFTGQIRPLGAQVLEKACQQIATLNLSRQTPLRVAVNRSPQEFCEGAIQPMASLLDKYPGLDSNLVCFELTESLMIRDPALANLQLKRLRDQGITLAMDDFGTGYSSLSYLKHYPFDILKIDRSFIADVTGSIDDFVLVKTIVDMAKNFSLTTVAEGVESIEQLELLRDLGCDYAQGYLFSPALPIEQFAAFLDTHRPEQFLHSSGY